MKNMLMVFATIFCLFSSGVALADRGDCRWSGVISGISKHTESRQDGRPWNEFNPGLGIEHSCETGTWDIEVALSGGILRNSEFGLSKFLVGSFRKPLFEGAFGETYYVGLTGGITTYSSRYNKNRSNSEIFGATIVDVGVCTKGRYCLNLGYIPEVKGKSVETVLVTGRFPFNLR